MNHGLKPIKRDKRDYSFHRTFGGITPIALPQEFSIDAGLTMPDQVADGLYQGCTAYAQQELCTDQDQVLFNHYREHYERTLLLENSTFGQGCDIRDSLKIAIDFYGRGAFYAVESSKMDWFDSICSVIYTNFIQNKIRCAVSIGTPWFKSWDVTQMNSTGIASTVFTGDVNTIPWHNWAIKGWKLINNEPYLLAKSWQGRSYGDTGWSYYSRETINAVMKIRYTGAFTVAPPNVTNLQFVKKTMLESLLTYCQNLLNILLKKKVDNPVVNTPPSDIIKPMEPTQVVSKSQRFYDLAFSLIGQHLTMDTSVLANFGCAESVSYILKEFGYPMPARGYAGTAILDTWLSQNCTMVKGEIIPGDIIISVTQGNNHGHVGICGKNAIMSNDSQTGLWEPYWSMPAWLEFYRTQKKLETKFYRL